MPIVTHPTRAVAAPDKPMAPHKGKPYCWESTAVRYALARTSAACPNETCPLYPVSRFMPSRTSSQTANMVALNVRNSLRNILKKGHS